MFCRVVLEGGKLDFPFCFPMSSHCSTASLVPGMVLLSGFY